MILLPEALIYPTLKHLYKGTHYGWDALVDLIRPHLKGPHLQRTIQRIIQACQICPQNNPKIECTLIKKGVSYEGIRQF